jgi:hypothetical protein
MSFSTSSTSAVNGSRDVIEIPALWHASSEDDPL